ncbi:adenylate/guanylate cyclase domain-containing protein [Fulvivirgaceae bacterium BMA12]|uniref:Adenylate/guanylate cyclase domain-containing protein n=1 Tax=Agaribacillus aureus TaxID=3051825 RepID=A0ABT8L6H6_9BACT|nr:adenylate/guanylate cyclase domain-containing protein [Fulvivirgaceae bacterium BMA12]
MTDKISTKESMGTQYVINYLNEERRITVSPEETILEASLKADIRHPHVCGSNARCSSCRVVVERGIENCSERSEEAGRVATKLGFGPELRLACQTTVKGDIAIRKPKMDATDIEIASLTIAESGENKIGEEKQLTIAFVDIEGYTAFTESVQAYDLVHVLNRYYYVMGKVIRKYNGQIIDYYGDGLLAVFGFKDPEQMAHDGVAAGKAMMKEVESFNDYLHGFLKHKFKIRVGIHTGKVIVGNIGFKGMRKLAVIGDAVNFASRIDHANKELNTRFLVSAATYEKVGGDFSFVKEHEVEVKGKKGVHKLYELKEM